MKRKFSGKGFPGCELFVNMCRAHTRVEGGFYRTVQEEMSMLMNVRPKLFVLHNKSKERVVGFLLGKERNMKY